MLMKTAAQSLSEQLAARFAPRIRDRLLAADARLPSASSCAQQQRVSPFTVVVAYDRLVAQGLVEARKSRSLHVRYMPVAQMEYVHTAIDSVANGKSLSDATGLLSLRHRAPLNATALIRCMFHGISAKLHPGLGVLPPAWFKTTFLDTAVRRSCSIEVLNAFSLQYGEPVGDMGRRRALLRRSDGPNLEVMARYCEVHQPKLFVSVSVFHNPTGFCLQPRSAYRVLQLANQHNVHIVEDDTYSHFAPEHTTRLCALDNLQRTIYVGGFTKILAPNWRVGYLVASPTLAERLLDTKLLSTFTTPALPKKALAWCIEQGQLCRHAERIRTQLDAARDRSGKLALAPGALFHAERQPSSLMRINVATTQEAQF